MSGRNIPPNGSKDVDRPKANTRGRGSQRGASNTNQSPTQSGSNTPIQSGMSTPIEYDTTIQAPNLTNPVGRTNTPLDPSSSRGASSSSNAPQSDYYTTSNNPSGGHGTKPFRSYDSSFDNRQWGDNTSNVPVNSRTTTSRSGGNNRGNGPSQRHTHGEYVPHTPGSSGPNTPRTNPRSGGFNRSNDPSQRHTQGEYVTHSPRSSGSNTPRTTPRSSDYHHRNDPSQRHTPGSSGSNTPSTNPGIGAYNHSIDPSQRNTQGQNITRSTPGSSGSNTSRTTPGNSGNNTPRTSNTRTQQINNVQQSRPQQAAANYGWAAMGEVSSSNLTSGGHPYPTSWAFPQHVEVEDHLNPISQGHECVVHEPAFTFGDFQLGEIPQLQNQEHTMMTIAPNTTTQVDPSPEDMDVWREWMRNMTTFRVETRRPRRERIGPSDDNDNLIRALASYANCQRGRDCILPSRPNQQQQQIPIRPLKLLANHFQVEYDKSSLKPDYFQYDLRWDPSPYWKEDKQKLFEELIRSHGEDVNGINNVRMVYDNGRNIFTAKRFQFLTYPTTLLVTVPSKLNKNQMQNYKAIIHYEKVLKHNDLTYFFGHTQPQQNQSDILGYPMGFIHALDLIIKEDISQLNYLQFGHSYYLFVPQTTTELNPILEIVDGYFQSVRALQGGLHLNVDFAAATFIKKNLPIIDYFSFIAQRSGYDWRGSQNMVEKTPFSTDLLQLARKNLGKLIVHSHHLDRAYEEKKRLRGPYPTYQVHGLTDQKAEDQHCEDFDKGSSAQIPLRQLLTRKFNYVEQYDKDSFHLPAIITSRRGNTYLTWGCCAIAKGNRFSGIMNDQDKTTMVQKLQSNPRERAEKITSWMQKRHRVLDSGSAFTAFKVKIAPNLTDVRGLKLPEPTLRDGNWRNNNGLKINHLGQFSIRTMLEPAQIDCWAVLGICNDPVNETADDYDDVIAGVLWDGYSKGMAWAKHPVHKQWVDVHDGQSILERRDNLLLALETIMAKATTKKVDLIICIMSRKLIPEYAAFKTLCDRHFGVPSQVVILNKSNRTRNQSKKWSNISLKINVKCKGKNCRVDRPQMKVLADEDTIVLGADVTHPAPGVDVEAMTYSIAAVVGSTDLDALNYAGRIRAQAGKKEEIEAIEDMVYELLEVFREKTGKMPKRILFFRDGVSESQFMSTLRTEGTAILRAARRLHARHSHSDDVSVAKLFIALAE